MIGRYYKQSRLRSTIRGWSKVQQLFGRSYDDSRLKGIIDQLEHVTRQAWLVRWLTTEPEPDVIVIDLSETWTVGSVIALLDRLLPHAERAWDSSRTRTIIGRTSTAFMSAPVQLGSALLLGVLLVQFVCTWASTSDFSLALLAFLSAPALLGLRVDGTWDELAESRAGQLVAALLVPPEPPDGESR